MRIVVLDGYTLNPGDLSWERLAALGTLTVHDRTPGELIVERSRGADVLLTNKTPLRADALAELPELKYVGLLATGYDNVDVRAAAGCGVTVTNVPGYGSDSVAQMVFALLLELCQNAGVHTASVRSGEWTRSSDFCYWRKPLVELAGKTIGLVGCGRIGEQVARIATAFGMHVIVHTRTRRAVPGCEWVTLDELLRTSDAVSLHCPLTADNTGMINKETLAMMKRSAFLINTARGKLIAEPDLAEALRTGVIAGAGLDVLSAEPPAADNPLLHLENCVITPHIAWATREARERLMHIAVDNLQAFLQGQPIHVVQP
jgi:glycerate dehydrogenase